MASQAVCKAQGVVGALARTSGQVARPAPSGAVLAPMHAGKAQVFAPQRPMVARSARRMATVTAAAGGLPIDLTGECACLEHFDSGSI